MRNLTDQYRILTPSEYESLRESIPLTRLRIIIDILLFSGMRYSELMKFAEHLIWFDFKNRAIRLPKEATKTNKERVIHLTPEFAKKLQLHIKEFKALEIPSRQSMDAGLRRWSGGCTYEGCTVCIPVSCKTFRKTWESWLLAAGYPSMAVALSQGHSELISYGHYANLDPRLKSEMDKVRELTKGWGT